MYQSFAMEAQADATRCCIIVILLIQLNLEKWGCNKGKHGGIAHPNISTALDFLEMCAEMIPYQVCVTIIKSGYFSIFFASLTLK